MAFNMSMGWKASGVAMAARNGIWGDEVFIGGMKV